MSVSTSLTITEVVERKSTPVDLKKGRLDRSRTGVTFPAALKKYLHRDSWRGDGVVTLRGTVPFDEERAAQYHTANNLNYVRRCQVNDLAVVLEKQMRLPIGALKLIMSGGYYLRPIGSDLNATERVYMMPIVETITGITDHSTVLHTIATGEKGVEVRGVTWKGHRIDHVGESQCATLKMSVSGVAREGGKSVVVRQERKVGTSELAGIYYLTGSSGYGTKNRYFLSYDIIPSRGDEMRIKVINPGQNAAVVSAYVSSFQGDQVELELQNNVTHWGGAPRIMGSLPVGSKTVLMSSDFEMFMLAGSRAAEIASCNFWDATPINPKLVRFAGEGPDTRLITVDEPCGTIFTDWTTAVRVSGIDLDLTIPLDTVLSITRFAIERIASIEMASEGLIPVKLTKQEFIDRNRWLQRNLVNRLVSCGEGSIRLSSTSEPTTDPKTSVWLHCAWERMVVRWHYSRSRMIPERMLTVDDTPVDITCQTNESSAVKAHVPPCLNGDRFVICKVTHATLRYFQSHWKNSGKTMFQTARGICSEEIPRPGSTMSTAVLGTLQSGALVRDLSGENYTGSHDEPWCVITKGRLCDLRPFLSDFSTWLVGSSSRSGVVRCVYGTFLGVVGNDKKPHIFHTSLIVPSSVTSAKSSVRDERSGDKVEGVFRSTNICNQSDLWYYTLLDQQRTVEQAK